MWGRLRIILLIASALLWAFYVVIDSSVIHPHKEPILDYVVVYGIFIYLGVNFIYLVRRPRK
jgi:drug/metabolite transporter (DMT)-like permease